MASAGPFTGQLDRLVELELAGAGAVVLPSIFEEQIEHETAEIDRLYTVHGESFHEATSFFPEVDDYGSAIDSYLELIENAKVAVDIPVIASLNGANIGGWVKYARLLEGAGADAVELNLYTVAADPAIGGAAIEAEHLELVALVAEEVGVPIAVKISPYYSSVASFVVGLQRSGAAGVVMFNRFYSPDLDLETLEVAPRIALSTPEELRLPLRWIGILREHLTMSIAGSTGVHSGFDAAKLILAGADVAMTTSSLLHHGPTHLATIEAQLVTGWSSTTTSRSPRCVAPSRAMPRAIRPPTSGRTTSATSPPTPAGSSAPALSRSPATAPSTPFACSPGGPEPPERFPETWARGSADGADVGVRVDGAAAAGVHLEVEVVGGGVAGGADVADHLAPRHAAARALPRAQVGVEVAGTAAAVEPHRVAAEAGGLELHLAGLDRHQRGAAGRHHVDAFVAASARAGAPHVSPKARGPATGQTMPLPAFDGGGWREREPAPVRAGCRVPHAARSTSRTTTLTTTPDDGRLPSAAAARCRRCGGRAWRWRAAAAS